MEKNKRKDGEEHYQWLDVAYKRYLREQIRVDREELERFIEWAYITYVEGA